MSSSIHEVKRRHEASLLEMSGIVSVGVGLDASGRPAIIVGITAPNKHLESRIPSELEGQPVVIRVVGAMKAL